MPRKPIECELDEELWQVRFTRMKNNGVCRIRQRKISINSTLRGRELLENLLHEMLHATSYHVTDEDWVHRTAEEMSVVLDDLGFQWEDEDG